MNTTGYSNEEAVAVFAHELREPLASILFAAQALDASVDDERASRDLRAVVERQSRYAATLIEDVLEVCRARSGKTRLRKDRFDLRLVAALAVETTSSLLIQRGHRLTLALPEEPVHVTADASRLQQVIVNLLSNAAKYTPSGEQIRLAVEVTGNFARIEVRDNGTGIPSTLLPHVFDFYRQGEPSSGGGCTGLGIGLALVKSLVELHGGSVRAYSGGAGMGSIFVVRLPLTSRSGHEVSDHQPFTSGGWWMSSRPATDAMADA